MKILIIEPSKHPREADIENTLEMRMFWMHSQRNSCLT